MNTDKNETIRYAVGMFLLLCKNAKFSTNIFPLNLPPQSRPFSDYKVDVHQGIKTLQKKKKFFNKMLIANDNCLPSEYWFGKSDSINLQPAVN